MKDKKGDTVEDAFKYIVKESNRRPKHIWVDQGKEFYNKNMDQWLEENKINRYSTYGEHKSCVVERFNRTIRTRMWKRFTAENTRVWVAMVERLLAEYNNTVHSTTGMTPVKCSKLKNAETIRHDTEQSSGSRRYKVLKKPKFNAGDKVRISRIKGDFEKGYVPNWSEATYVIHDVKKTNPRTYTLKDMAGEILEGSFYEQELQKTNQETYRIEKILRKKKINGVEHALVKWMGYNDKFNQWMPVKALHKLQ